MDFVDEMICRSVKGATSLDEEQRLLAWRREAPANESYYTRTVRMLEVIGEAGDRGEADYAPTARDLIGIAEQADPTVLRGLRKGSWIARLSAAAAVLVIVLGGLYYTRRDAGDFSMGAGEYVSGPNEMTTATLADGTVVRLAPNSRLRILDAPGRREVFLSGHAYFAVTHMRGWPFRVRTGLGEVQVLGMRFDVQATNELRIVVVQGTVALSTDRSRVEVGAGEMSVVADGTAMQPVKVDVPPLVDWIGRFIAFQETPLSQVARELELEYGKRIVLADSGMAGETITGWYIDRSFEEVLVIVCGVLGVACSVENGTATIGR